MENYPSGSYYGKRLSAERLRLCYELAPPRVSEYLAEEIRFVESHLEPGVSVLELGCGYGRVLGQIAGSGRRVTGVDTAIKSLEMAAGSSGPGDGVALVAGDAADLPFADGVFDVVICIQNGISAFGVNRRGLVREAMRVTGPAGKALFSSYAESFWPHRLEWFRIQAAHGLVGEIDEKRTADGVIVCRDGFRAETISGDEFVRIGREEGFETQIAEHNHSSLFCVYRRV